MGRTEWVWTERPEYGAECESLGGGDGRWVDIVKSAIEDNVLLDPIEGSKPVLPPDDSGHDPSQRYITVEEAPGLGAIPALLITFRIESPPDDPTQPREITGWWIERA
jgi:hypothetical protein